MFLILTFNLFPRKINFIKIIFIFNRSIDKITDVKGTFCGISMRDNFLITLSQFFYFLIKCHVSRANKSPLNNIVYMVVNGYHGFSVAMVRSDQITWNMIFNYFFMEFDQCLYNYCFLLLFTVVGICILGPHYLK